MVSLHAAVAHGKPALREQGVQPQGLLPVPLSLQIKANCQHIRLQVQGEKGVSRLHSTETSIRNAVGWN